tara:strand:- start:9335 stop:9571 length:237 start_codon:yes stop_codon:yes gene_type:complete
MSNKNPFEIRSDILSMAKDYMDKQYDFNMNFASQAFQQALDSQKVSYEQWEQFVPKQYDIIELMEKASELYSFVSKKD